MTAGDGNACALLADHTVACWGYNLYGQLGNGTTGAGSTTPIVVSGLTGVVQVVSSDLSTCALLAGGTVECWGDNNYGSLGLPGSPAEVTTPTAIPGLSGVTAIAMGAADCALLSSGTVEYWGGDDFGSVGDGTTNLGGSANNIVTSPVPVVGLTDATVISGSVSPCALSKSRGLVCWGDNSAGELGNGSTTTSSKPVPVVW